jgi:cystathionine beta-lyase family protein involved in aluminum resistance
LFQGVFLSAWLSVLLSANLILERMRLFMRSIALSSMLFVHNGHLAWHAGISVAPNFVGEALKGALLVAEVMRRLGFRVTPEANSLKRPSYITAIELGSEAKMVAFCRALQGCSPVGAYIVPEPGVPMAVCTCL